VPTFAASSVFAVTDNQRAASLVEIGFHERQRFLDARAGSPEDYDQSSRSLAVRAVVGRAHHGDDLLHFRGSAG
jgi:hypothetical protein